MIRKKKKKNSTNKKKKIVLLRKNDYFPGVRWMVYDEIDTMQSIYTKKKKQKLLQL